MKKKYCASPWRGLHINPAGAVKTCCAGNPNFLGDVKNSTIDEILNNEKMKEVRQQMKQGVLHPVYCSGCIDRENLSGTSEREWHNNISPDFDFQQADLEYDYPALIDARWNKTCNLSCNYCDSANSSTWAAIQGVSSSSPTRKQVDSIIDLIKKNRTKVVEVAMVGGEPLLLKENIKVLEFLAGTNTKVTVVTNLSVNLTNNPVFNLLKKHKNVGWSLSFENLGERFEYVRHGAQWEQQVHNVCQVVNLMNDLNLDHSGGLHAVYSLYNCTRLVELKEWANELGLNIMWQVCFGPNALVVANQPAEVKTLALAEIDRFLKMPKVQDHEVAFFETVKASLEEQSNFDLTGDQFGDPEFTLSMKTFIPFIEETSHPDTKGQFEKLWPEIYQALGPL
jgi:hypothetical protein